MQDPELIFFSPMAGMQLCSPVRVAKPESISNRLLVRWFSISALWDTGAVTSGISRRIAEEMRLEARERAILSTAAGMAPVFKDIVLLDLMIDNCVIPVKVAIVDSIPGDNNDFLIGMDIIRCGYLQISPRQSKRRI